MSFRHFVFAVSAAGSAVLGVALFTSPVAYAADELFPPGTGGPSGPPTDVTTFGSEPWFEYSQGTTPYNVLDADDNIVGTLGDTRTAWDSTLSGMHYWHDTIIDGTGTASAWTGAVDDHFSWLTFLPIGSTFFTIFGNDYLQTPDGTSDYVTLFNDNFPLFDTFPGDSAPTAADTPSATVSPALGAALVTDPSEGLFPPGTVGPSGSPTDVTDYFNEPWLEYSQSTTPYNVLDGDGTIVGTLGNMRTSWDSNLLDMHYGHDVIVDGTGTASAWTGALDDHFAWLTLPPIGPGLTIFGNDYLQTPDGASDFVTLFNTTFPLFDTFPTDPAPTAADTLAQFAGGASDFAGSFGSDPADVGWLTDLGQLLDLGSLF